MTAQEATPETKPDCICAVEELADKTILPEGWVLINRNCDGHDGIGIKYLSGIDVLARLLEVEEAAKELADEMDRTRARAWNAGTPAVWTDVVAGWAAALRRLVGGVAE